MSIRRREMPARIRRRRTAGFAATLAAKYRERLSSETLMVNELYLSVVYRPVAGAAPGLVSRLASTHAPQALRGRARRCHRRQREAGTDRWRRRSRATSPSGWQSMNAAGDSTPELLEFFGLLLNAEWQAVPLPRAPLNEVLATTRLIFGTETIEYRLPTQTRFGAILGIKEYATPTTVGMFDALLSAPFEFVLTQSFAFLSKATGQGLLQRQYNQMSNAGDFAVSQAEELQGRARCADEQRVRDGRPSLHAAGADERRLAASGRHQCTGGLRSSMTTSRSRARCSPIPA